MMTGASHAVLQLRFASVSDPGEDIVIVQVRGRLLCECAFPRSIPHSPPSSASRLLTTDRQVIKFEFSEQQCSASSWPCHVKLTVCDLQASWEAARLWLKGVRLQPRPAPPDRPVTIVPLSKS